MKKTAYQQDKLVYKFTTPTYMKFVPKKDFEVPVQVENTTFLSGVKRFLSNFVQNNPQSQTKIQNNTQKQASKEAEKKEVKHKNTLKYVYKLTAEQFIIGNEDQLDGISVVGIIDGFVDTQYLWSINLNKAIHHVVIDNKKNYIIVMPKGEVYVFAFKPKSINQMPLLLATLKISEDIKFVQIVRDGSVVLLHSKGLEVYTIRQEAKEIRLQAKKSYEIRNSNLKLFQIPQPYENILNIFFQDYYPKKQTFTLWNIEVQFLQKEVKMSKVCKIYQLATNMRSVVTLENYSKDVYFINLGEQIFAIKKGYVIDSARVNKKTDDSHLKFFPHEKLLHISQTKLQVYRFLLNSAFNPPKIILKSTDSIEVPFDEDIYQYLEMIQVYGDNYAIFYQKKDKFNRSLNGQIKYTFIMTQFVRLEQKIKNILPSTLNDVNLQKIEQKADMATKMGLERKNIYLRLWNNSSKTQVSDYQFLLDTLDYQTIKFEIQKKLKKSSMNYRQLLLIEQGCLSMLSKNVFGEDNSKQHIKNYMISHLLIRKLKLYKNISLIDKEQGKKISEDEGGRLLINIQNYNLFRTLDVKSLLIQFMNQICNQQKKNVLKIRSIFRLFRFSLRIIYLNILTDVVTATKKKFLQILKEVPQILPYDSIINQRGERLEGIWSEVAEEQWERSLYIDTLVTIQNKGNIQQLCQSVWFKRNCLNQQDYVNMTRSQIQQIQNRNASDVPFYHVIAKVFQHIRDYPTLRAIIDYIQDQYQRLPNHILGKIFIYHKLYQHFKDNQKIIHIEQERIGQFSQFLKWKDSEIFKAMFNYEKLKKGFILKQMKPLYAKLSGAQTFMEGLLNYFVSSLSEVSDIKYILNRMNNQKKEFHQENEGIYEVLVRGMQIKLKLGGEGDIPIDEVLIYIQNIPLPEHNPVFKDLEVMRSINGEADRFKQMKLNMSLFHIAKNMDEVLSAAVEYELSQAQIVDAKIPIQFSQIRQLSYRIIENLQALKMNIYQTQEENDTIAFIYLSKLLEDINLIGIVGQLLEDQWFSRFDFNQKKRQNLVLFMYQLKLTRNPSYIANLGYLRELLQLLPNGSDCKSFIEAEINIAKILSTPENHVTYPLNNGQQFFNFIQLQRLLSSINKQHLLEMNIEQLYDLINVLQRLSTGKESVQISLKMVYQIIIIRILQCNLVIEVFPKIKQLFAISPDSKYLIIYLYLVIAKISPELVEENKTILYECVSYLHRIPTQLLNILQALLKLVSTTQGQRNYLNTLLVQYKQLFTPYCIECGLFDQTLAKQVESQKQQEGFTVILKNHMRFLAKIKQEYNNAHFYNTYIILCNDPYVLPLYIYSVRYQINFKHFRGFLSFLSKAQIFNKKYVIQFVKRMFIAIYEAIKLGVKMESICEQLRKLSLDEIKEFKRVEEPVGSLQRVIVQCIERMRSKGKHVTNELERRMGKGEEAADEKIKHFKQSLNNPSIDLNKNRQYPFPDSDDNRNKPNTIIKRSSIRQNKLLSQFDPNFQRMLLFNRSGHLADYLSPRYRKETKIMYQQTKRKNNNIFNNLSIDRIKLNKIEGKSPDQINDAIRNSIRRSRSRDYQVNPPEIQKPLSKSSHFLIIEAVPSNQQISSTQQVEVNNEIKQISIKQPLSYNYTEEQIRVQVSESISAPPTLRSKKSSTIEFKGEKDEEGEVKYELRVNNPIFELENQEKEEKQLVERTTDKEENIKEIQINRIEIQSNQPQYQVQQSYPQVQHIPQPKGEKKQNAAIPFLGNIQWSIQLLRRIILKVDDTIQFNLPVLQPYSNHESFKQLLIQLLKASYQDDHMSLQQIINFSRALSSAYPFLQINKTFLQIYEKADRLQSKFNLDLPLKLLFGPQGILIEGQHSEHLFKYLLPRIIQYLNEQQLLKACKVVTLSFKKSQLEHEIMLCYLIGLLKKYEQQSRNTMATSRQKIMLKQKIEVILTKIPLKLLKRKDEELINSVERKETKSQIAQFIINSCQLRYDAKMAEYFEQKYLANRKNI